MINQHGFRTLLISERENALWCIECLYTLCNMMLLCVYVYIFIINSNVLKCSFSYMVVSVWVCFGDRCVQRVLRNPVLRMRLDEGGKPIGVIVFLSIRACHLRQVGPNSLRPHLRHLHLMSQLSCDCHVWRWWFKQVGEHVQTCSNDSQPIRNPHRGEGTD